LKAESEYTAEGNQAKALYARVSRLRGDSETVLSYPVVSQEIATLLDNPLVRSNPELRLRCLVVKAAADLSSKDPVTSGRVWSEALETAQALHDQFWIGRISGELAVIAFLKGDTATAVKLNARAFQIAHDLNDLQGEIRQKSLGGVGLLEQQRYDDALIRFDDALKLARTDPDVRFPLMAIMGKAQALEDQGNFQRSMALRKEALQFVEAANVQVYKADLLLALAGQAIKRKHVNEALGTNEVLLEYVMDDPESYCLTVTKTSVNRYRLEGRSIIEHKIGEYLDDTKAMRQAESAKLLYRYLFEPISEYRQKSQVIIVPDGKLGFIPFDALVAGDSRYAIQTHTISYVPSATVLFLLRSARRAEAVSPLFAIGSSNSDGTQTALFGSRARGIFDLDKPTSQLSALPSVTSSTGTTL
jgi:tetratricopeptide (TPR) repeat protein